MQSKLIVTVNVKLLESLEARVKLLECAMRQGVVNKTYDAVELHFRRDEYDWLMKCDDAAAV